MIPAKEAIILFETYTKNRGHRVYNDSVDFGFFIGEHEYDMFRNAFAQLKDEGINYSCYTLSNGNKEVNVIIPIENDYYGIVIADINIAVCDLPKVTPSMTPNARHQITNNNCHKLICFDCNHKTISYDDFENL